MRQLLALAILAPLAALAQPVAFVGFDLGSNNDGVIGGSLCSAELSPTNAAFDVIDQGQCFRTCTTTADCTGASKFCLDDWGYCRDSADGACSTDICDASDACFLPHAASAAEVPPAEGANPFAMRLRSDPHQSVGARYSMPFGSALDDGIVCMDLLLQGYCSGDNSRACGSNADCSGAGVCTALRDQTTILELRDASQETQCMVTIGCTQGTSSCACPASDPNCEQWRGRRQLKLWYNDPLQKKCSESFTDGTYCNGTVGCNALSELCDPAANECPAEPGGVPKCNINPYAQSLELDPGTWHRVCVEWSYSDRSVECALSAGEMLDGDERSHVVEAGRRTVRQGECDGGDNDGHACAVDADCPSATCVDPAGVTIAAPTHVVLGLIDYTDLQDGAVLQARIDNVVAHDLGTDPTWAERAQHQRWATLTPNANSGGDQCNSRVNATAKANCGSGDHWGCVSDPATGMCDGNDTYLVCLAGDTDTFGLTALPGGLTNCATDDSGPCIANDAPVAGSCTLRENTSDANAKPIRFMFRDASGNADAGTLVEAGTGAEFATDHVAMPYHIATADPLGGAWSIADIDALDFRIAHEGGGGGQRVRVSSCVVNVAYEMPEPIIARVLTDVNGDGEITVVTYEDSRLNGDAFINQMRLRLFGRVDNFVQCATGGRICGDFVKDMDRIADGVANWPAGGSPDTVRCTAVTGSAAPADYVIGGCGANNWFFGFGQGTCSTGGTCTIPEGHVDEQFGAGMLDATCVDGVNIGQTCLGACSGSAEPCAVGSGACPDSGGDCAPLFCGHDSRCTPASFAHIACAQPGRAHGPPECLRAACGRCSNDAERPCNTDDDCESAGTCSNASGSSTHQCDQGIDNWCWRKPKYDVPSCPGGYCGETVKLNYVQGAWQAITAELAARTGSDEVKEVKLLPFDPGDPSTFPLAFGCQADEFRALRHWAREWAPTQGVSWVDQHERFFSLAPGGDVQQALTDNIHLIPAYLGHTADLVADCLLGIPGHHDCTALYTPCDDDGDCAAQANTTCQMWPGTASEYCLGVE